MYTDLRAKYSLLLPEFNKTQCFSTDFRKISQVGISLKIRSVGAELFHADGRTDRQTGEHDRANSRFSQFCERV
jgi:hypothetical protein